MIIFPLFSPFCSVSTYSSFFSFTNFFFPFLAIFFLLFILLCSLRFLFVFFLFSSSKSRDYGIQLLNKSSIGIILEGRDGPRYTHSYISSYKVWTGYESHTNMSFCFDNRMIYLKFFPKN